MGRRTLTERRVLVTGASRGIGRALCLELARHQSRLAIAARSEAPLKELAEQLGEQGARQVVPLVGDLTEPAFRQSLVETLRADWQGLDVLVNNAGVSAHGKFEQNSEQALRHIMEVNFFAATELTRQLLPMLHQGQDSVIVNIGSIIGHRGLPFNSEYSASKFALRGWSEAIRAELASSGIGVLMVSPGSTDTEFFDHLISKQGKLPWGKQKGISPQAVGRQVVRAIQRRHTEIFPNWRGRSLVLANRWFPRLVDRVARRYGQ